jgi:hypothetical protein
MHVVLVKVKLNDPEAALENLRSQVIPRVSQAPGFLAGYWYGDQQTQGASTLVFDSEDNANGFVEMVRQQPGTGAATIEDLQVYEVVAHA